MSQSDAPAVTPYNQVPCVVVNGNNFYSIYGLSNGSTQHVCGTIYDGKPPSWRNVNFTSQSNYPSLMTNGIIKALLVGSTIYVVYQSTSAEISIFSITGADSNGTYITSFTAPDPRFIGNFCLYTDGTSLFIITNESGILWSQRLKGSTLDTRFQLTGSGGKSAPMNTAVSPGQLTAKLLEGSYLHCIFEANAGVIDVFQRTDGHWTFQGVIHGGSGYKGLQMFHMENNEKLTVVNANGTIDILKRSGAYPHEWQDDYLAPTGFPPSRGAANIDFNQYGAFITYADTSGKIQCLYDLNNQGWNVVQIGGEGCISGGDVSAPAAAAAPGVGVYNNFFFHCVYVTNSSKVYDLYWYNGWNDIEFYPKLGGGSSELNDMANLKEGDKKMMQND